MTTIDGNALRKFAHARNLSILLCLALTLAINVNFSPPMLKSLSSASRMNLLKADALAKKNIELNLSSLLLTALKSPNKTQLPDFDLLIEFRFLHKIFFITNAMWPINISKNGISIDASPGSNNNDKLIRLYYFFFLKKM